MRLVIRTHTPEWHAARTECVTGTEMAALFDEHPWVTRADLVARKRATQDIPDNPAMWWGRESEEPNLRAAGKILGARVRPCNLFIRDGLVGASLDGLVRGPGSGATRHLASSKPLPVLPEGNGILELKQTREYNARAWRDGPPRHYWWQVQTQLLVTGHEWGVIACRLGAADMILHRVDADPLAHDEIRATVRTFMEAL